MYIVEASSISKLYHKGQTTIAALKDVSLQIKRGEIVAIMGPSGSYLLKTLRWLSHLTFKKSGVKRCKVTMAIA